MKTRNGFVSNSSSSSFIIAVKPLNQCKHCGRSDPDIIALLQTLTDSDYTDKTEVVYTEIDAIIDELKNLDSANDNAELIKTLLGYKDKPEYKVAQIKISNHDIIYNDMLKEGKRVGNIIVLNQEEC